MDIISIAIRSFITTSKVHHSIILFVVIFIINTSTIDQMVTFSSYIYGVLFSIRRSSLRYNITTITLNISTTVSHHSQEKMLSHIPDDHQEDPGEIVEISTNPWQADQVMIGYRAGFMMVWDLAAKSLLNILKSPVNLDHFCWKSEDEFYSSHSDGNYTLWDAENGAQIEVLSAHWSVFFLD